MFHDADPVALVGQKEHTTKRHKTLAYYKGGEEGRGWLRAKILTVALWEGGECQKRSKSRIVMVGNKKCAKGRCDNSCRITVCRGN